MSVFQHIKYNVISEGDFPTITQDKNEKRQCTVPSRRTCAFSKFSSRTGTFSLDQPTNPQPTESPVQ